MWGSAAVSSPATGDSLKRLSPPWRCSSTSPCGLSPAVSTGRRPVRTARSRPSTSFDDNAESQADSAVLHPRADDPAGPVPRAEDVLLIAEVAESSLVAGDRYEKAPRYAAARIPMCWILDLAGGQILVLSAPGRGIPRTRIVPSAARPSRSKVSLALPVTVDEILGAA